MFYQRGRDGLPRHWLAKMKAALREHAGVFNTNRMVREYAEKCYFPSADRELKLRAGDMARAKELAAWKENLSRQWPQIGIVDLTTDGPEDQELRVGDHLQVQARVNLGSLEPADVTVELYYGRLNAEGLIEEGTSIPMLAVQSKGDGQHVFSGALSCTTSGQHGYALRILPHHEDLGNPFEMGLILWGG